MDFDEINRILDLVRVHELAEFELEHDGFKIRIKKGGQMAMSGLLGAALVPAGAHAVQTQGGAPAAAPEEAAVSPTKSDDADFAIVKSPIVGTFFRASEPGAPPFFEVGSSVRKGQVLCIIEAMKLMNEIESEFEGEIVKIYVENGQPVQYGERLFAIKA